MFSGGLGDVVEIWLEGLKNIIFLEFLLLFPLFFQFFFFISVFSYVLIH